MGLDLVELVMEIEEEFGLDIPDYEAEKLTTVGSVYEWLKIRVASFSPVACLTQRVFYKLRRALIANYNLERRTIEPNTRLTDLMPLALVESGWPFLQMFIDLKTPPFKVANEFLGWRLSDQTLTMRELVEALIVINGKAMAPQRDSEEEIWNRLVGVILRHSNVTRQQITPEASFTKDLGLD